MKDITCNCYETVIRRNMTGYVFMQLCSFSTTSLQCCYRLHSVFT